MKPFIAALWLVVLGAACAPAQTLMPNPPTAVRVAMATPTPEKLTAPKSNPTPTINPVGGTEYETTLGKPVTLRVRDAAVVTDTPEQFTIYFWGVPQDSRCPINARCMAPGEAQIQIIFAENGLLHPPVFTLAYPTQPTQRIENYNVTVTNVQPERETTDAIPLSEYQATFVITQNNATPTAVNAPKPTASATPADSAAPVQLDEPFIARVHQTYALPAAQMQLTVNSVLEDSRCPTQVACVWAGRAVFGLTLVQDGRLGYFHLSTMPPDAQTIIYFRGYAVQMLEVSPHPQSPSSSIPDKEYRIKLVVQKQDPPTAVHKNEPLVLKPGQSATLNGEDVTLTFERVEKDSRCPYPAQCAVQGSGILKATLRVIGNAAPLSFDTAQQRAQTFENYAVELLTLAPYPQVDQTIAPDEYEATFVIRKYATAP